MFEKRLSFFTAGFRPCRRPPFVLVKGSKTIFAHARKDGELVHRPESGWLRNSLRGAKRPLHSDSFRQRGRIRAGGPAAPNVGEEAETKFIRNDQGWLRFFHSMGIPAFGCGGAGTGTPNQLFGESCLTGASSLAIVFGVQAEGPLWGRRGAEFVLGPLAETK